jgi:hypothetical protein
MKMKWYLSKGFIILMFLLFPLIIPPIIGSILYIKRKQVKREIMKAQLEETGFKVDKKIDTAFASFYIDDTNKKWAFRSSSGKGPFRIYNYSDLLSYEIYEDGDSVMKGKTGGSIVGGLTFGLVGAVVGSAGRRKTKNTCHTLQVRITVDDLQNPEIVIPIIVSEVRKDSTAYKSSIEIAKNLAASLTYIQKHADVPGHSKDETIE